MSTREERWEKCGYPERMADEVEGLVLTFGHSCQQAAEESAEANRDDYGHPSWTEERDGRWVSLVDLRPAIARIENEVKERGGLDKT